MEQIQSDPAIHSNKHITLLKRVVLVGVLVMGAKFMAYYLTHSNAIFSDALESIINVIAGAFAIFSLYYANQPKDENHPYGHGKIEFFSAGFEGAMIFVAGISILIKAFVSLVQHTQVHNMDYGIILTAASGVINFVMGKMLINAGEKIRSMTLVADGKHLLSDTYSSIGLLGGLVLIYLTGINWLDSVLAIAFALVIMFTGYKLLRKSMAGLMDETDTETLKEIEGIINQKRQNEWIDIHNLRILKYGSAYHIDCHMTLPWFWDLDRAHQEVRHFEDIFRDEFPNKVELFVHADPCLPHSCKICLLSSCDKRKHDFAGRVDWTLARILKNEKHMAD